MSENVAYLALAELAHLSQSNAVGLPAQVDVAPRWSGVGFSLLGERFVAPLGQVTELMEVPPSTRLPSVQPWVMGLSNVRGRLLPLFDLAHYFNGKLLSHRKSNRVLVLETDALYSGLVVDSAFGMQHFSTESYKENVGEVSEQLLPFVAGAYEDDNGELWKVFSVSTLAEDSRFTNVSV